MVAELFLVRSVATLAFFETWDGPPLWVPEYRWAQVLVVAIAAFCFGLLCVLAIRRQLLPLHYIVLSLLPLFAALLLSVGLSVTVFLRYYGPGAYYGQPPEQTVVFALLCSVIAAPFSVVLLLVFGIVLFIRRPNQSLEPTAGQCNEKLEGKTMNEKVKVKLAAASGGSACSR